MLMYFGWELVFLPLWQCRPAKQDPAVQACDYISSPHCLPQIPPQKTCCSLHQQIRAGLHAVKPKSLGSSRLVFWTCIGVWNISSACVYVPNTIFIDEKVCREGGSVSMVVCYVKKKDTQWERFKLVSERLTVYTHRPWQCMKKAKRKRERSNFHPEWAYTFSR